MADQPNIVFMLGDNVGWGDLGCFGGWFRPRVWTSSPAKACASPTLTPRRNAPPRVALS